MNILIETPISNKSLRLMQFLIILIYAVFTVWSLIPLIISIHIFVFYHL